MKSINNIAFGLRKATAVIKSSMSHSVRLWVVVFLAMISGNMWGTTTTSTVILPAGSTTYTSKDWRNHYAPSRYSSVEVEETICVSANNGYSVKFYHAADYGNEGLQLERANGAYIQMTINSSKGVDVVIGYKSNGTAVPITLTGASDVNAPSSSSFTTTTIKTTSTSATLTINGNSGNVVYISYISITPKTGGTITLDCDDCVLGPHVSFEPPSIDYDAGDVYYDEIADDIVITGVNIPNYATVKYEVTDIKKDGVSDESHITFYIQDTDYPYDEIYVETAGTFTETLTLSYYVDATGTYTGTLRAYTESGGIKTYYSGGMSITLKYGSCTAPTVAFSSNSTMYKATNASAFTRTATAKVGGSSTGQTINYSSSNTSIATVSSSGVVTIKGVVGNTTITATAVENSDYCEGTDSYQLYVYTTPTVNETHLEGVNITPTSATFRGGQVSDNGGLDITAYGYVIGTSSSVDWDTKVAQAGQNGNPGLNTDYGTFTTTTDLTPGTQYYLRVFADNGKVFGYSTYGTFKTPYAITLNKNNTDPSGSTSGSAYIMPDGTSFRSGFTPPTREHYTVEGYYTTSDCSVKIATDAGSLQASVTVGGNTWTDGDSKWKRGAGETFYTKWTPDNQTISFNANGGGSSMSSDVAAYGSTYTLPANGFTAPAGKVFDHWAAGSAGGTSYAVGADYTVSGDITFYAVWTNKIYADYKFTCSDLSLDNEALSKVVWMTTYAGEVVRSANPVFKISGSGLNPGAAITFTLGGNSANNTSDIFSFRAKDYSSIAAHAETGALAETEVYAFYNPTATTDGLDLNAVGTQIVATAAGGTSGGKTYMELTATLANVAINGRHLPSQFVIAAKWGGTWYALPADFTKTTSDADCNGIPVAISVDADGSGNPTQAYGPSTLAYTVNMVGNGGTGTYTFKDNSKYLYLDMINNSHYALEAAGSGTSVARGNGYATGDLGANFMWLLDQQTATATTAAETEYHICNAANTANPLKLYSTENRWGLYSAGTNVATPAIRLIPLSEVEPLELSVLEWGETSIAVKSASVNLSSGYTVTARLGSAAAATVSSVSKIGDDLYIIRGVGSLLTGSGIGLRSLTITATPAEGTAKQAVLQVPLIISNDAAKTPAQYVTYTEKQISSFAAGGTGADKVTEGRNIVKTVDVVVRKGGMLTNESTASGDFANLHIYSGGKVDITQGIKFKNVYLRGGFSWLDNQFDSLPRLKTAGNNITLGGKVYYDLCLNSDMYYMMALPVDVSLSSVTNEEGTSSFKAWIKKYNGGARAGENSDPKWISVTSGSLQRGVGYEVAIKKRNNRPYGILRFPLLSSWSAETDFTPTVTAWGSDDDNVTANNKGWNLVGNPFFTAFHNTNEFGSKIVNYGFKQHGDPWDGTYEWDEEGSNIKFFSIPYRDYDDWHDERAIDAKLEPFFPFGVQVKSTGVLTFKAVNRDLKPSIVRKAIQEREVDVDFLLKDANGKTDNAGLTIGNTYSELFDSEDMEKTITNGTQYMKVYTMVGEYRTAFNYLPEAAAAQPIPVGYIAPAAGEYTFTLKPSGNYSQVEKVLLTDYQTSQTVDLLTEDYTFETEAGEINTRFALNVKLKAETATDMSSVEGGGIMNISVYGGDQHLVVRGLPTGADVWIYDAAGKLVASWNNVREASLRTDVPAAGVYSVRAVLGSEGVTRRAVVR